MNKRKLIYYYLVKHQGANITEIANAMPWDYFHNRNKYFGEICSRMVKRGWINRVKKGYFEAIMPPITRLPAENTKNQLSLKF